MCERASSMDARPATWPLTRTVSLRTTTPPWADRHKRHGQSTGSAASPQAPPSARTSGLQTYFTSELKFPTSETYRGLNLDINAKWKFDVEGAMSDPVRRIAAAMKKEQPRLRVFWAGGYYDITTPLYAGKYILDRSGIPPERLTVASFPTGHSVFEGDDNLAKFTEAVRQFARGGTTRWISGASNRLKTGGRPACNQLTHQ